MTKFFHRGLSCFPEASRLNYNRLSRFGKEWFELCLFHNSPAGFDRFVGPFHSFEREGMTMAQTLTLNTLEADNRSFAGTGGISQGNWHCGFIPGFLDRETGAIYHSRRADGSPASFHALDGLPDHLILARDPATGRVMAIKASVIAGFVRWGCFYTREQAACCLG
ncbi:MAG TPA: hypothetical protein PKI41_11195 [Candidatus Competibacteraceae bacterium]|nr:hypothetical protein [Candidatus Competibacteraceae bacterium]HQA26022.1 hypothetical protein [Candidatus Competibacteraceae bacterium]HQD57095.1 hypothetical protein [Candidatus Competibacteraceae bacterium]